MKQKYFLLILMFCLGMSNYISAQQAAVLQGEVTSSNDGYPIIGASVSEIDANNRVVNATITDFNGKYVMKIKNSNRYK